MIDVLENGDLKWYHIFKPLESDIDFLKKNFNFHLLDLEDCLSKTQRPKIDVYDDYYFVILHFPHFDSQNKFIKTNEVKIFWGKNFMITIGNIHWIVRDLFNSAKADEQVKMELMKGSSDLLFYNILERLLNESFKHLTIIGHEIEIINLKLFGKEAEKIIEKISITRKNIILLDTIFKPQLRLFYKFETEEIEGFAKNMYEYWSNILDMYKKIWDITEDYEEEIEALSKTFDSLQTNRTNEIVKVLTLISSILLPLTLIASLYGMNIKLPFQSHPYAFLILTGCMVIVVLGFLYYFKKRKWIK
ncbi:MAG TPA: magnesium transporter CorA family protein [Bacteroidales bacterium]|nr:magnesium transporter CorA family protein [Bacteroidales bacterium]HQI45778.1 magnesium transporter CorA family protein [Bacteroidales bacterium]